MNQKIIIGALSFTVLVLVSGASFVAIRNQANNPSSTNITLDTQGTIQVGSNADIAAEVTEEVTPTPTEEEATPAKMQDGGELQGQNKPYYLEQIELFQHPVFDDYPEAKFIEETSNESQQHFQTKYFDLYFNDTGFGKLLRQEYSHEITNELDKYLPTKSEIEELNLKKTDSNIKTSNWVDYTIEDYSYGLRVPSKALFTENADGGFDILLDDVSITGNLYPCSSKPQVMIISKDIQKLNYSTLVNRHNNEGTISRLNYISVSYDDILSSQKIGEKIDDLELQKDEFIVVNSDIEILNDNCISLSYPSVTKIDNNQRIEMSNVVYEILQSIT